MKHLVSINQLSTEDILRLLDRAALFEQNPNRKLLEGRVIATLFFEPSTRTRLSFETAVNRLGGRVIGFSDAATSSSAKGESLKDTALTLQAMGADAVIVRHSSSGAAHRLAHAGWMNLPVLNAGDGTHQHPTQALLDAMTLRRHFGASDQAGRIPEPGTGLDGAHVVIVGDVLHSRVARSNVDLLTLLGARVTLVAPPTLLPLGVETWNCKTSYNFDEALATQPDAVMMLRVQRERMSSAGGGFFPSPGAYHSEYGLTPERFAKLRPDAVVMHPGPMNRGLEICAEAADSPQSVIVEQVSNGVCIRMAALYLLLASEGHNND